MDTAQSFTARRSAASHLPTFQLPPPDHISGMHKYQAYAPSSSTQTVPTVSSVLTPPGLPSDGLSPVASSVHSGSSSSSNTGVPPYQPMNFWPTPQNPQFSYSSGPSMGAPFAHQHPQPQQAYGRPLYSPMSFPPSRNTQSPTASEGLPAPPYDLNLPPFPTGMSSTGSQHQLPNLAPQHHHQQQQQQQQQQEQQQQQIANGQHSIHHPSQGPVHASDTYGGRPPPTPTYYNTTPASTPQQSSFPAYVQQSPTQSPNTTGPNRISPISAQTHPMSAPNGYHRPYPSAYNLPAMAGPIMSNVHSPGGQMSLVGGMSMQYPPHHLAGQVYGHQQAQTQNDRPFRCDVCPQSFNRNHDLKRHKRIHLAVKPFPCNHCDKSFSRKDALKRHILVKGCGTKGTGNASHGGDGQSPISKADLLSDSTDDSPRLLKKEI